MKKLHLILTIALCYSINTMNAQTVSTFAGSGITGSTNATGVLASFNTPEYLCQDIAGNTYVSDAYNHLIRKITPAGVVTTFAGSGTPGAIDATGIAASFNYPTGICADAFGNLYVAEYGNNKVRKITPAGIVTTFAGSGVAGSADGTGIAATFDAPVGICIDFTTGNFYVAELNNNLIRKITPAGVVTTFAGTGLAGAVDGTGIAASFNGPYGICSDISGNIYVADAGNNNIRKITATAVVTTFAGTGSIGALDGTGTAASFYYPYGVCSDASGNIFVADTYNNKIRKISSGGVVTTYAGAGAIGSVNGAVSVATFNKPYGICADASGNIYIADTFNNLIRMITSSIGIFENDNKATFSIFPNPGSTTITINTDEIIKTISIFNLLGELMTTENSKTFSISKLTAGVYMLQVQTAKGVSAARFVKE